MEVIWENPPPQGTKWAEYIVDYVNALKARPGEWGELPPKEGEYFPSTLAASIRKYNPHVETTMRPAGKPNRFRIWGKYNAPEPEPTPEPEPEETEPEGPPTKRRGAW